MAAAANQQRSQKEHVLRQHQNIELRQSDDGRAQDGRGQHGSALMLVRQRQRRRVAAVDDTVDQPQRSARTAALQRADDAVIDPQRHAGAVADHAGPAAPARPAQGLGVPARHQRAVAQRHLAWRAVLVTGQHQRPACHQQAFHGERLLLPLPSTTILSCSPLWYSNMRSTGRVMSAARRTRRSPGSSARRGASW
ncbi:hypothetical protein LP420_07790 [Massilia sp. B-10]|nr:hypothetical protein LP420_07790 [Massilia sp. B-10]